MALVHTVNCIPYSVGAISASEFKALCYELGHCLSDQEISLAVQVLETIYF